MSKELPKLTRRRALLGLGGIGASAALGGAGTMALLKDNENSTGNVLTAGKLDLRIDWTEHYNGNQVENQTLTDNPGPIFDLDDVKPGDSGEATISVHVDDNPAWLYMGGTLSGSENTYIEPEKEFGDQSMNEGELADELMARVWYDEDGDNTHDGGGKQSEPVCVELVLDASGSMSRNNKNANTIAGAKSLAEKILSANANSRVGVTFFSAAGYDNSAQNQLSVGASGSQDVSTVKSTIDSLPADGSTTAIGAGVDTGHTDLENCPSGMKRVMVVLSNGGENAGTNPRAEATEAKNAGIEIVTLGVGTQNAQLLKDVASDPDSKYAYTGTDPSDIQSVFDTISTAILTGEEVIAEGTLAEVMSHVHAGVALDGDRDASGRQPYPAGQTEYLGFEWWLPKDTTSVVQTDSVEFDLKFHAQQRRHNDHPSNPFP